MLGRGVDPDEGQAHALFERACELGDQTGCAEVGLIVPGVPTVDAMRSACEQEHDFEACFSLGALYDQGDELDPDRALALRLLDLGCAAGSGEPLACFFAGQNVRDTLGDLPRAARYLRLACDRGVAPACEALDALASTGGPGFPGAFGSPP